MGGLNQSFFSVHSPKNETLGQKNPNPVEFEQAPHLVALPPSLSKPFIFVLNRADTGHRSDGFV
jgi:hypothetical protein